jgi:hypothetical protein
LFPGIWFASSAMKELIVAVDIIFFILFLLAVGDKNSSYSSSLLDTLFELIPNAFVLVFLVKSLFLYPLVSN